MNWDQIEGNWKRMKGTAQSKWGELTNDDLDEIDGSRDALEGKLQAKYGKTKEDAKREVEDWLYG